MTRTLHIVEELEDDLTYTLQHVFENRAFQLRVRSNTTLSRDEIECSLVFTTRLARINHGNKDPPSEKMIRVHSKQQESPNVVSLKLSLQDVSEMQRNEPVRIVLSTSDSSVTSRPVMIVRYQFKVTTTLPSLWYKDEGGREKAMSVSFSLTDANGKIASPETNCDLKNLIVKSSLVYGTTIKRKKDHIKSKKKKNGSHAETSDHVTTKTKPIFPYRVNRHDEVYTQMHGTVLSLDSYGNGRSNFRIDEVTKNHQNQSFRVMISADSKKSFNIAFGLSNEVTVRSKRNKRKHASSSSTITTNVNMKRQRMMMMPHDLISGISNAATLQQWAEFAHTSLLRMRNDIDSLLENFKVLSESAVTTSKQSSSTDLFLRSLDVRPVQPLLSSSSSSDTTDNSGTLSSEVLASLIIIIIIIIIITITLECTTILLTIPHKKQIPIYSNTNGRMLSMPQLDRDMSWGSIGTIGRTASQMDILANAAASPSSSMTTSKPNNRLFVRQTSFDRSVASIIVDEKQQRGGTVGIFSHSDAPVRARSKGD